MTTSPAPTSEWTRLIFAPLPPPNLKANYRIKHWGERRYWFAKYKAVTWGLAKQAGVSLTRCIHLRLTFCFTDRRGRDIDNLPYWFKAGLDGLVAAGFIPDDGPVWLDELVTRQRLADADGVLVEWRPADGDKGAEQPRLELDTSGSPGPEGAD